MDSVKSSQKQVAKKKNIHEGHRARLFETASKAGLDALSEFQVLELLLAYVFPRGDTNPLAHALLEDYDDFANVVDADVEDLKHVPGINHRSATMIHMFSELFFHYASCRMGKKPKISCFADIIDLVETHLRFRNSENLMLFALSPGNVVTGKRRINTAESKQVGISVSEFTNFLSSSKAVSLVVGHCHPYGTALPSLDDEKAFKLVSDICHSCGVNLVDSLIVGDDGVFSQKENRRLRTYTDVAKLKDAFVVA